MLEFGSSFRKSRESLNVSIDKIAVETRISSRFLLAIENEQFDQLPGGIFNRGFIRTYAQRLGLDPEEAVLEYEKLFRAVEAEPARQETERVRGRTTKIPVYYVAIAGLLILVVVYYFITHRSEPLFGTATTPSSPTAEAQAANPNATPAPDLAANPNPDLTSVSAGTAVPPAASPTPVQVAAFTPAPAAPVIAQTPAPTTPPVIIEMDVREESWFKLSSDGAEVVPSEVLSPGTVRRYTATSSMDVSIGNAAGVMLRVNGQPVPSLGRSGQVRVMTITPKTTAISLEAR